MLAHAKKKTAEKALLSKLGQNINFLA